MRRLLISGLAVGFVALSAQAAWGGEYPPAAPTPTIAASSSTSAAGATITVTGDGWDPNSNVNLTFNSAPVSLGSATTNAAGSFSKTITIPCADPGTHTINVAGTAGACTVSTGALASTGASTFPTIWVALAAIAIGAVLTVGARRRTSVRARL